MSKKDEKSKEYADWLHKNLEEQLGHKCAKHDMYYRNGDIHQAFESGWDESLKSQWIIPSDRLPKLYEKVLVIFEYEGEIQIHDYSYMGGNFVYGESKILAWMPIPSFDEILKENKDVLEKLNVK